VVAGVDGPAGWAGRLLGAVLGGLLVLIESGAGRTTGRGAGAAG